jgi:polyhydroxyalkanoate synthesis repressor PhaR
MDVMSLTPVTVIKKYPNRRLYDPDGSRYITHEELTEKIRSGRDVVIVDANTGEDLTQATLTQLILESRGGARLLPVPLLLQLMRLGDGMLAEFLGRYMSWSLEMYLQMRSQASQMMPWNPFVAGPSGAQAFARMMPAMMGQPMGGPPFHPYDRGAPPAAAAGDVAPPPPPPPSPPPPPPDPGADVEALRRELEELKRAVRGGAARPAKSRAKRPKRGG